LRTVEKDELQFGYRSSNLKELGLVIVSAVFNLSHDEPKAIMERFTDDGDTGGKLNP